MDEFTQKLNIVRQFLAEKGLDALLLNRVSSFAWATCGASSYINTAASDGVASLLFTPAGRYLITNNIEAPRFEKEEGLAAQGWEFRVAYWHKPNPAVAELTAGLRLGADSAAPGAVDLSAEFSRVRACLLPVEVERFKELGKGCAQAMDAAIRAVRPGMTEYQIAGLLAGEAQPRGIQAIVNLIATDERIFSYRHPLPTGKKLERYAMLVLCGRWKGLVCSITRLVYFGSLPEEIRRKASAVAQVDAVYIAGTRPGRLLGDIFAEAQAAYAQTGFADQWNFHHQGGPAGYEPREYVATPGSTDVVAVGQVYAWNPSITGVKSEDTVLVGEAGNQVLTEIAGWPVVALQVGKQTYNRPAILEVKS